MVSYNYLGYGVTDENGIAKLEYNSEGQEISHSYTGVGAGEIDVLASLDNPIAEGSIVSETFVVDDTYNYDNGTQSEHHDIWTDSNNALSREPEYSLITEPQGTDVTISTLLPSPCIIEADVLDDNVWAWFLEITQSNGTAIAGWSLGNAYSSAQNNTWYHIKLEANSTNGTLSVYNMQGTLLGTSTKSTGATIGKLLFKTRDTLTKIQFKNFRIYNG